MHGRARRREILRRQDAVPLPTRHNMIIIMKHASPGMVKLPAEIRIFPGSFLLSLSHAEIAPVRIIVHQIRIIRGVHLHSDHLEESVLFLLRQGLPDPVHHSKHFLISMNTPCRFIPPGSLGKGIKVHLLHLAGIGKLVKFREDGRQLRPISAAESSVNPLPQKSLLILRQCPFPARLPGISRIEGHLLLQGLHGPEIGHPDLPNPLLISLFQLIPGMGKGNGADKQIRSAWRRPVGIVIIQAVSSPAPLLLLTGIAPHITVIVIDPDQRQILRHLKSVVIELQYLLIWNKGFHRLLTQVLPQQLFLGLDHRIQKLDFGLQEFPAGFSLQGPDLKAAVMNPPHMHCRPDIIHFQPKQQLKYFLICLDADGGLSHITLHPVLQFLFIIDKNAPVLYRGPVCLHKAGRYFYLLFRPHRHIREKIPGTPQAISHKIHRCHIWFPACRFP